MKNANYNPKDTARKPGKHQPWERHTNSLLSPGPAQVAFKIPKRSINQTGESGPELPAYTFSSKTNRPAFKQRPHMQAKGLNRKQHMAWIRDTGLPESQRKVKEVEGKLAECKQEIELLDMQMLAIGTMHGTAAYETACARHLDLKMKNDARLQKAQLEHRQAIEAMQSMEVTLNTLGKEEKAARDNRMEIRKHAYYRQRPHEASIAPVFTATAKTSNTCLLYTSPSPRD